MAMVGCSDFLDVEPDERVDIDTDTKVVQLLATSYPSANYGWLAEISSDNIIDNNAPHLPANANSRQLEEFFNLNSYGREDDEAFAFEPIKSSTGTDTPSVIWSSCYNAVAGVNHALQALDQIVAKNDGKMNEVQRAARAEGLLIRAYSHFILVNMFSKAYKDEVRSKNDIGIPYMTDIETTVDPKYDRGNVTDTYAKIQKDLEEALTLMSDVNFNTAPTYHFNTNAAHAFAARFYLYKRDYEKVIEHADSVLGTDRELMVKDLMDYSAFKGCTYGSDYADKWKDPNCKNNLMLMPTYSGQWRRMVGGRYNCNGLALRSIYFRSGPTWGWTIQPTAMVSGGTFYDGKSEHGFTWSKLCEQFQYTDKVAGIGYAHILRREFTRTELLLCRAEAYLLGRHDKENCFLDLAAYEKGRQQFSEEDDKYYRADGSGLLDLEMGMIDGSGSKRNNAWFARGTRVYGSGKLELNCFADWDFAANMGVIVADDEVPFMNAINDYRRFETSFEGLRFFDVKRWGIEYTHRIATAIPPTRTDYMETTLTWDDDRRALEIPQEVISAGLQASRPVKFEKCEGQEIMKPVNVNEGE